MSISLDSFVSRRPDVTVVARNNGLFIIGRDRPSLELRNHCLAAATALSHVDYEPVAVRQVSARAGLDEALTVELIRHLVTHGALVVHDEGRAAHSGADSPLPGRRRVVLGVCGSIQAAELLLLPPTLRDLLDADVEVVLSGASRRFVRPETFSYLGFRVWTTSFEPKGDIAVPHTWLAGTASVVLVMPATANGIAKIAAGLCSDLLSLIIVATEAPVIVVPTMSRTMFNSKSVRRNLDQLRRDGIYVVDPGPGWEVGYSKGSSFGRIGIGVHGGGIVPLIQTILDDHAQNG